MVLTTVDESITNKSVYTINSVLATTPLPDFCIGSLSGEFLYNADLYSSPGALVGISSVFCYPTSETCNVYFYSSSVAYSCSNDNYNAVLDFTNTERGLNDESNIEGYENFKNLVIVKAKGGSLNYIYYFYYFSDCISTPKYLGGIESYANYWITSSNNTTKVYVIDLTGIKGYRLDTVSQSLVLAEDYTFQTPFTSMTFFSYFTGNFYIGTESKIYTIDIDLTTNIASYVPSNYFESNYINSTTKLILFTYQAVILVTYIEQNHGSLVN